MAWTVLIPVKRLDGAKSRLVDLVPSVPTAGFALAFAADTVAAALATPGVARVVVVTDDALVTDTVLRLGARVAPDPGGGLNAAVAAGQQYAAPGPTAALPSDLPALTPADLGAALVVAVGHHRAFVADGEGTGTTLLTALDGPLHPHYGPGSAAAHEGSGATRLIGHWPGLARDVDTPAALEIARGIGLGPATTALCDTVLTLCCP